MSLNPHVKICTHVKVTGVRCGSPALRGARFCYFHERMLNGVPTARHARMHPVALLENEEAIQVALMEVINAVLRGAIDNPRAHLIIRALNIAARNARRVRFQGNESQMVRQTLEPYAAEAPAAALGRIPLPASTAAAAALGRIPPTGSTKSESSGEIAPMPQLRRACPEQAKRVEGSERMQPTARPEPAEGAQAVGKEQSEGTSPEGAKETAAAPTLRSMHRSEPRTPAHQEAPRKPPGRVASAVVVQAKAAVNATPIRE